MQHSATITVILMDMKWTVAIDRMDALNTDWRNNVVLIVAKSVKGILFKTLLFDILVLGM